MRHQDLIRKMTLREKAAFLTGKNEWTSRGYESLGIPSIMFADGPSGMRRQRGDGDHLGLNPSIPATCFPSSATMANSWDERLEEKVGAALAKEAILEEVDVILAPGLNIKRNPLCGRNFEYFSEDPYVSGKMAAAMIRGIQSEGVGACAKHFAVNSQEGRRMAMNAVLDERTMRELYLTGFEIAVREGRPRAVMSAYNEINGTYANENPFLLKQVLREEWGFDGFVVTDWGGGNDFTEGVKNGSNLQMPGCGLDSARELLKAVDEGRITEEEIDERVDELLDTALTIPAAVIQQKEKIGEKSPEIFAQNHQIAERAALESAVLLKNEDDILPLNPGKKIAVIGDFAFVPRYQGAGSSCVNAIHVERFTECIGMDTEYTVIGTVRGYQRNGEEDEALEAEAIKLAENADVILFFLGLGEQAEAEGVDRKHLHLAGNQTALLHKIAQSNPSIVAVLNTGSVVSTWWMNDCKAVLYMGLSGEAGAAAAWKLLRGEAAPCGKLTESWIRSYEDTPSFPDYPAKGRNLEYNEGIYVGYRYLEQNEIPPVFPFGYGISYTKYQYEDLRIEENGVSLSVKNIGKYRGSEIVQMYVGLPASKIDRPKKELKGFRKVWLEPGETKRISIPFDDKTFRFFCTEIGRWETETGTYEIVIGASSQDIRLSAEYTVKGTWERGVREADKVASTKKSGQEAVDTSRRRILQRNDPLSEMLYAKNAIARGVARKMREKIQMAEKQGQVPDLNLLFQYNMPFRAIAKMTEGMVSMEMADGLLTVVNGHFFGGIAKVIAGFVRNRRENKAYEKALEADANREKVRHERFEDLESRTPGSL